MEQENTYVIDPESGAEMARLIDQDIAITHAMGGLFPRALDFSNVSLVLDVACGPGGWAREVAFQQPSMQVTGIDISRAMIDYANSNARVQGLKNVSFKVMNATRPLAFSAASFDLVNARFMVGFLHKDLWPQVIKEFARITRPGGFIVLTECDNWGRSNSEALERLNMLGLQAMARAGLSQHPLGSDLGATTLLGHHLRSAGCQDIRYQAHVLDFSAYAPAHQTMFENLRVGIKLAQPFGVKAGVASQEEFDSLYDRAFEDMRSEHFCGIWSFLTAFGQIPTTSS